MTRRLSKKFIVISRFVQAKMPVQIVSSPRSSAFFYFYKIVIQILSKIGVAVLANLVKVPSSGPPEELFGGLHPPMFLVFQSLTRQMRMMSRRRATDSVCAGSINDDGALFSFSVR